MPPGMVSAMAERPHVEVGSPVGGWPAPWPNVAELEGVLPCENWTLIGGLMTQVHAIHRGLDNVRPTNDIDIILHVEAAGGTRRPTHAAAALESLGYRLEPGPDPRSRRAHRFVRDGQAVDLVASDVVDVVIADHAAPRVLRSLSLKGKQMVQVDGGTQALKRTMSADLEISPGRRPTTISVPRPLAAAVLKAAAYRVDSRERDRHLFDAAVLLACIGDPFTEAENLGGSDRPRLRTLQRALADPGHPAWQPLPTARRQDAMDALDILCE